MHSCVQKHSFEILEWHFGAAVVVSIFLRDFVDGDACVVNVVKANVFLRGCDDNKPVVSDGRLVVDKEEGEFTDDGVVVDSLDVV